MRFLLILAPLILGPITAAQANPILPAAAEYDAATPAPASVLGFEVGQQHVRHDQLVAYYKKLAAASDRVKLIENGRTYEGRQQLVVIISHPDNLARLDAIRAQHKAIIAGNADPLSAPVILWQGYSIHGDEPSGANAALLYAYHLAASQSPELAGKLRDIVVLIDPALNPDGLARYAQWVTANASFSPVTDPAARVHHQQWPGGRTNHYWFDLNRDYLLLQHPVSRHRVHQLVRWRPHIVTDHHEMGSSRTFFFQPGVPERTHPLTPQRNQELTAAIADFHAQALDEAGRLYYTRESYDDFYYGKGSTYPDITGGIGILFEQAGSEGPAIKTPYGVRDFAFSVKNQFLTSVSTFDAAYALRDELRRYQADFFAQAREMAANAEGDGYLIGDGGDPGRGRAFVKLLLGQGLEVHPVTEPVTIDGATYQPGHAWFLPFEQTQYRFIEAAFETRTQFPSHVFYDVSAWTLPLSFDLPYGRSGAPAMGESLAALPDIGTRDSGLGTRGAVAYAFRWAHSDAPAVLQELLEHDIVALGATKPFTARTPEGDVAFERGAIVVPLGLQTAQRQAIETILQAAVEDGIRIYALTSGMTPGGIELGSPSLEPLKPVKPLLVAGPGISPYEAGQVWFLADRRLGLPMVMVEPARLPRVDLNDYTHLILVNGRYGDWGKKRAERIKGWVEAGGVLIAQKMAAQWVGKQDFFEQPKDAKEGKSGKETQAPEQDTVVRRDYADYPQNFAETLVSGTIFATHVDTTHPLGFGLTDRALPVFLNQAIFFEGQANPYQTVVRYANDALLAGYISPKRLKQVAGSPALTARRLGEGLVVEFAFNPNFRAVWRGTERLFVNALYYGAVVEATRMPEVQVR